MERLEVSFVSSAETCAAWLYLPAGASATTPAPAVIMAHGFGLTRGAGLPAYAERFAAAGLAVLVFDYRHFGDSTGQPRQLVDIGRQLDDWRAALAWLRGRHEVDPARIALWGTSFSGGHVQAIAARDHAVAAVVAQVPFADGVASARMNPVWTMVRLAVAGARDLAADRSGGAPVTVPAVGVPGSVAIMTSPDAVEGYLALVPDAGSPDAPRSTPWVNAVPARIALEVGRYRPGRHARHIECPLLVQVGTLDEVTPAEPALRGALAAIHVRVRSHPVGHFEVYRGAWFEQIVAEQVEFLTEVLLGP
jgi:dienelactone hydrolase